MVAKRIAIFSIIIFLGIFAAYFLCRNYMLHNAIEKASAKLLDKFHIRLSVKHAAFSGLLGIEFREVSLVPLAGDTLFYCEHVSLAVTPWRYFKGLPPVNNISLIEGSLNLVEKNDSINNYEVLLKGKETLQAEKDTNEVTKNYKVMVRKMFRRFFKMSDFNIALEDFHLNWKAPGYSEMVFINQFTLKNTRLTASVSDSTSAKPRLWKITGTIDPGDEQLDLTYASSHKNGRPLPFIEKLVGIKFFLSSAGASLRVINDGAGPLSLDIYAAGVGAGVNHWRISPEDVILDTIGVRMKLFVDDTSFRTNEDAAVIINRLTFLNHISFSNNDRKIIGLDIRTDTMDAGQFFSSLPKGLFNTLDGFKASGKLRYKLHFFADLNHPDQLEFDSELIKQNFKILKYGNENFSMLNHSFTYTAREKDRVMRVFTVGPENPNFTPLNQISAFLISAVLISEDGTFYTHNGFNEEAFRQSIATNIKEKRFARGGSTITMQLVKNVFLNRNKTVSRKVEEAIIVWLIENNNLVSKQRMLEAYLNLIEWGPGIYGIGEASAFYFDKRPIDLNLEESIYLTSIIPKPKAFKYSFDKDGMLREYLKGYFTLVAGRMLKKEIITQTEFDFMRYQVELKGPARQLVIPTDTIPADSTDGFEIDLF